jgi:hypothetical protein
VVKVYAKTKSFLGHPSLLCALALVSCVALAHPIVSMGVDDDFSYMWIARKLADTGHIVYNGWSEPMLGWQLYLGALFIKLFGFSYTVMRLSVLVVAVATVVLINRLFVRFGINEWNASVGTLAIAVSPLFLPLAFSFMTDIPGLFCVVLCIYGCVRALQAETIREAIAWLVFAGLTNIIGGTVRQVVWLGVLVLVPSATWWMRRRRGVLLAGALLWIFGVGVAVAATHWFKHQPYTISESILGNSSARLGILNSLIGQGLAGCLLLSPILIGYLVKFPWCKARMRKQACAVVVATTAVAVVFAIRHKEFYWLAPFSENFLNSRGLLTQGVPGVRLEVIPHSVRVLLTAFTFAALAAFVLWLCNASSASSREHES